MPLDDGFLFAHQFRGCRAQADEHLFSSQPIH
jgi:hypothetical protein